jgi:hypothetical protein
MIPEEPETEKELMQTGFSASVIESLYLRQNETTTTECEEQAEVESMEQTFKGDTFKNQGLKAEVLDYKQLTQNALRNIEML